MSDNYVEVDQGVMDIHYSREDGSKINWIDIEFEKDTENRYFVMNSMGTIVAVLEDTTKGWVVKFMVGDQEVGQLGLPDEFTEKILRKARENDLMV